MQNFRRPFTAYAVAVLSVGAGIALPLVSKPFVGQSAPYVSFIPAVVLSAWYGGFVPGLVTTALLAISTFALEGILFTGSAAPAARAFGAVMFVVASFAVCLAIRAMRLAQAAALEAAAAARAAESRAQAERDRLDVIVRDLPVGVLIATSDAPAGPARVELANPAAREILGEPVRLGDDLHSLRPESFLDSAGERRGTGQWPIERSLRNSETLINEEIDLVRRDGAARTVMINSRPLQGQTGRTSAIATYSDVTSLRATQEALRESETRLRRLFDSPIIGVVSGEGDIASEANDGFLRMLGYSRDDLRNGVIRLSALTPPEFRAADARIDQQLAARGFSDPVSKELIGVDGRRVPVMVGVTAFAPGHSPASSSSAWIAWVLDLSEHRKLEERLRQAAKAESVGLLAGGVAHDFNNLLTIIMGNISLTHATLPPGSPEGQQLDNALRAGERAADLTRQLLAYAGKGQFIVGDADVSTVIRDVSRLFHASAPEGVAVRLDLPQDLPMVNMDATQIQQLVMNLVINGVESLNGRPGFVRVSTSLVDVDRETLIASDGIAEVHPGRYVQIEVTDDGCGMDAETRKRVFDPFFTTKFTGRGLGLAAAAGIVQQHHGGIFVESTPGRGSRFRVLLPTVASTVSVSPDPAAPVFANA